MNLKSATAAAPITGAAVIVGGLAALAVMFGGSSNAQQPAGVTVESSTITTVAPTTSDAPVAVPPAEASPASATSTEVVTVTPSTDPTIPPAAPTTPAAAPAPVQTASDDPHATLAPNDPARKGGFTQGPPGNAAPGTEVLIPHTAAAPTN